MPKVVKCAICGFRTRSIFADFKQGVDCAASVVQLEDGKVFIFCSYGSDFDTLAYEFLGIPEDLLDADPVCDGCILTFIEQGAVKVWDTFPNGRYPWGRYPWTAPKKVKNG